MGYIYKVTNTINGKVYIGQTRRTVEVRWNEHKKYSFHPNRSWDSILHFAIRKYGVEPFVCEEIEQCDNSKLDERERYWIKFYGSSKNGYNACLGGGGGQKCDGKEALALWDQGLSLDEIAERMSVHKATVSHNLRYAGVSSDDIIRRSTDLARHKRYKPVYQYSIDGDYIGEFPSLKSAQEFTGCDRIKFDGKQKLYGGFQWRKFKVDKIEPTKAPPKKEPKPPKPPKPKARKVSQFSLDGEYIATFESVSEAAKAMNTIPQRIYAICDRFDKTYNGYQWRYADDCDDIVKIKPSPKATPVHQYTMDGEYVASFDSIYSATKQFDGMRGTGGIRGVCTGRNRHSHGYRWSYEKVDHLPEMREENHGVSVDMLDLNGNYIRTYKSVQNASKDVGVHGSVISVALGNKNKTAGGYKWAYSEKAS